MFFFYVEVFLQKAAFSYMLNFFLLKGGDFLQNVLLSAEMLNMLNHALCSALLSAEMLNMLNMLNVLWPMRLHGVKWAKKPSKYSTYSTYSTFQQKEAIFRNLTSNMIQHIQHFNRKKHFSCKKRFFLLKC